MTHDHRGDEVGADVRRRVRHVWAAAHDAPERGSLSDNPAARIPLGRTSCREHVMVDRLGAAMYQTEPLSQVQ